MDEERGKFQFAGLKFLYDMELVDDPQLINNLKMNIFDVSAHIRDVEFLSSYHHKSMLIYLDLNWFGRTFLQKRLSIDTLDRVKQLLPNFRFRVVTDRKIFDLALEKVRIALKGDANEKSNPGTGVAPGSKPDQGQPHGARPAAADQSELPEESGVLQDPPAKAGDR